jgi:hypothetical protein
MRHASALIVFLSAIALTGQAQSPSVRISLHGRVVAADGGAPLRNARVQTITANQAVPPAFTDADGRFAIAAAVDGSSRLSVTKPGYVATTFAAPRTDEDIELRLPKASAISGRITDTLGDPVIGMTVTAESSAATESVRKVVATSQTDDLGEYRLAGLPAGRFFVSVNSIAPAIGEAGTIQNESNDGSLTALQIEARITNDVRRQIQMRVYYPGVQTIGDALPLALSAGEERPAIDLPVPARKPVDLIGGAGSRVVPRAMSSSDETGVIRGRVVAIDGRVLPQTIVRLEMDAPGSINYPAAITDPEGRYEFQRLGQHTYTVTATRAGFLTTAYGQRRPSDSVATIELRPGERRDDVDMTLSRPSAITGRVVDDAGEPVEGAGVRVLHVQYRDGRRRLVDAGGQGTHRSDDRGAYRIYGLPPDEYIVSARVGQVVSGQPLADLPGFSTSYYPATANPGEAQRIAVNLAQVVSGVDVALVRAPTARISVTIVDAASRPLDDGLIPTFRPRPARPCSSPFPPGRSCRLSSPSCCGPRRLRRGSPTSETSPSSDRTARACSVSRPTRCTR